MRACGDSVDASGEHMRTHSGSAMHRSSAAAPVLSAPVRRKRSLFIRAHCGTHGGLELVALFVAAEDGAVRAVENDARYAHDAI